jgi:hypothetical protein
MEIEQAKEILAMMIASSINLKTTDKNGVPKNDFP